MRNLSALFFLLLSACDTSSWFASHPPLQVGTVSNAPRPVFFSPATPATPEAPLIVSFNQPMADFKKNKKPKTPFSISPPLEGSFEWISDKTVMFKTAQPLPAATRFKIIVPATLQNTQGHILGQEYFWNFETEPLTLLESEPVRGSWLKSGDEITLVFNEPVDAAEIKAFASLSFSVDNQTPQTLPFEVEAASNPSVIKIKPKTALPSNAVVTLVLGAKIKGLAGPLPLAREEKLVFGVKGDFEISAPKIIISPTDAIEIPMNHPVAPEEFRAKARLMKGEENIPIAQCHWVDSASLLACRAALAGKSNYSLVLPEGLKDLSGRPLKKSATYPFTTRSSPPLIVAETPAFKTISLLDTSTLEIKTAGLENLTIKVWKTSLPEFIALVAKNRVLSTPDRNPDKQWNRPIPYGDQKTPVSLSLASGLTGPGLYVVEVGAPEAADVYRIALQVSSFSLHYLAGPDQAIVWLTRLTDGEPVANARLAMLNADGETLWDGATDEFGIETGPPPERGAMTFLIATQNKSEVVLPLPGVENQKSRTALSLILDRAFYKPGDTARLQVQSPFAGGKLLLASPEARCLAPRMVDVREGLNTLEIRIPDDLSGLCTLTATLINSSADSGTKGSDIIPVASSVISGHLDLNVQPGRSLHLTVATDKGRYEPGEKAVVRLAVQDETGEPVGNLSLEAKLQFQAPVEHRISSWAASDSRLPLEIKTVGAAGTTASTSLPNDLTHLFSQTDANGVATFSVSLPQQSGPLLLEVTARDQQGLEVIQTLPLAVKSAAGTPVEAPLPTSNSETLLRLWDQGHFEALAAKDLPVLSEPATLEIRLATSRMALFAPDIKKILSAPPALPTEKLDAARLALLFLRHSAQMQAQPEEIKRAQNLVDETDPNLLADRAVVPPESPVPHEKLETVLKTRDATLQSFSPDIDVTLLTSWTALDFSSRLRLFWKIWKTHPDSPALHNWWADLTDEIVAEKNRAWVPSLAAGEGSTAQKTARLLTLLARVNPGNPLAALMAASLISPGPPEKPLHLGELADILEALDEYESSTKTAFTDHRFLVQISGSTVMEGTLGVNRPWVKAQVALEKPGISQPLMLRQQDLGPLYYRLSLGGEKAAFETHPVDRGLAIHKQFIVGGDGSSLVRLLVVVPNTTFKVVLDDYVPQGFEWKEAPPSRAGTQLAGLVSQLRQGPEGRSYYAEELKAGVYVLEYQMKAGLKGRYPLQPTVIRSLENPDVYGATGFRTISVK